MPELRELLAQLISLGSDGSKASDLKKQIGRELQMRRVSRLMATKEFAHTAMLSPETVTAVEEGKAAIAEIMVYHKYVRG